MSLYPEGSTLPSNYTVPPWPSLSATETLYIFYTTGLPLVLVISDFWYFIMLWTLVFNTSIYAIASIWAYFVFRRYRWSFLMPIVFTLIGATTGFIQGSVAGKILSANNLSRHSGLALSAVYQAGSFKMSTWIALVWGLLQAALLLLGSFSTITSIL